MKKIVILILFWHNSYAVNYYVKNGGSNSNDGLSDGTAWATMSKVQSMMATFNAGDNILFKAGSTFTGTLEVTRNGNSSAPITIGKYDVGNDPVFTGTGSTIGNLFLVSSNHQYVVFNHLRIYDPTIDTTIIVAANRTALSKIQCAFQIDNGASHCTIKNCYVSAVGIVIYCAQDSPNNIMDSCRGNDLTMVVDDVPNSNGGNDFGSNLFVLESSNNRITHCQAIRCYAHSFDYTVDGGNDIISRSGTITNNYVGYCYFYDCLGVIELSNSVTNTTMEYCISVNCGENICMQNNGISINLYNNDFVQTVTPRPGASNYLINQCGGSSHTAVIKNNLFHLTAGLSVAQSGTGNTHENNIYRVSGGGSIGYTIGGSEATSSSNFWVSQTGAPQTWDYNITNTSPAYQAGQNLSLTPDYAGNSVTNPPDAGALQYQSVTPPPANNNTIKFPVMIGGKVYGKIL